MVRVIRDGETRQFVLRRLSMRVRRVRKEALAAAVREPWADPSRRPYVEGETAWVPVRDGYPCDDDLPERRPYGGRPFQMIGDTAVVRGRRPTAEEVAAILAWRRPAACCTWR